MKKSEMNNPDIYWDTGFEFLEEYLPKIRKLSNDTVETYRNSLNMYMVFLEEELNIARTKISFSYFEKKTIEQFQDWQLNTKGCSAKTTNLRLSAINSFLEYACDKYPLLTKLYVAAKSIHRTKAAKHPIEYFEKDRTDEVITLFESSKDPMKKEVTQRLVKQKEEHEKKYTKTVEEFDEIKTSAEDNDGGENDEKEEKDIDKKVKELYEKAKTLDEAGNDLLEDITSVKGQKSSFLKELVDTGVILEARADYERAKDEMNYTTAKYIVQKNIITAEREAVVLDINRALGRGEDVSALQEKLINLNNQAKDLDNGFQNVFPEMQAAVSSTYQALQETRKRRCKKS